MSNHFAAMMAALGCQADEQLWIVQAQFAGNNDFSSAVLAVDVTQAIERFKQDAERDDCGDWDYAHVWLVSPEDDLRGVLTWTLVTTVHRDESS